MSNVIYKKISPNTYDVSCSNGVALGQLQPSDDGFYVLWPDLKGGYWAGYVLREIANKLDELNAPWEKMIDDYHAGESSE
jgi:hypothetical protein